jgi:valyl-tRNA synthetase
MPFVTEAIYRHLVGAAESIMVSDWPLPDPSWQFPAEEQAMVSLMDAVRAIRTVRADLGVPPSRKASLIVVSPDPETRRRYADGAGFLRRLAGISGLEVRPDKAGIPLTAVTALFSGGELYLPLADLIDLEREIARLQQEKANLEKELARLDGKLENPEFSSRAPARVIQAEKDKLARYQEMHRSACERLATLKQPE